jgi:rfaE bifunctional protein kinase chain/domain
MTKEDIINSFDNLNILVIGDSILDEYIYCKDVGVSAEDFNTVYNPIKRNIFLGGSAIVASHCKSLGAKVDFVSIIGDDDISVIIKDKLNTYNVTHHLYINKKANSILKQRFKVNKNVVFRLNTFKDICIDEILEDKIIKDIKDIIKNKDLLIFSDFNYGFLSQRLIDNIINIAKKYNIKIIADSQTSSQKGDISKYKNIDLITPTKKEAQIGVNDFTSSVDILSNKLKHKYNIKNVIITLGKEGAFVEDKYLPSINKNAVDIAGAGDSMLVCTSMAYTICDDIYTSVQIGSMGASIQVSRIGNIPINKEEIKSIL